MRCIWTPTSTNWYYKWLWREFRLSCFMWCQGYLNSKCSLLEIPESGLNCSRQLLQKVLKDWSSLCCRQVINEITERSNKRYLTLFSNTSFLNKSSELFRYLFGYVYITKSAEYKKYCTIQWKYLNIVSDTLYWVKPNSIINWHGGQLFFIGKRISFAMNPGKFM